jgi:mRNA-degrading endonuclease toxin of MazEF toxin-antitoxin module
MPIKRGHLYIIDFNPRIKTKPGKLRPALVLQSDLVNEAEYPSTIVIPTTTRLVENPGILRIRLKMHIPLKSPSIPKQTGSREVGAKRRWEFVHSLGFVFISSPAIVL